MKFLCLFASILLLNFTIQAQCRGGRFDQKVFSQVKATKNITYHRAPVSNGGLKNVLMDVFEPKDDTMQLRPLVVFMHGGAYWKGSKNDPSQIALGEDFAKRGYVYCSANYRLESSPVSLLFPNLMIKAVARGVQDTKTLVKYFFYSARHEGNPFRIDTTNIFLCGSSAGAFNALHTVFLDEEDELDSQWKIWMEEVGGVFGEYDFIDFRNKIKGVVNINGALGDKSYMNNNFMDFLSVHNTRDPQVPFNRGKPYSIESLMEVDGSNVLHAKALEMGMYNPFYIIPGRDHTSYSDDIFNNVVQPYFDSTVYYMKEYFMYMLDITEECEIEDTVILSLMNNRVQSINLFPNPTPDLFYIDAGIEFQNGIVSIYDISGRELYREQILKNIFSAKEIGLGRGIYIVQFSNEKEIRLGKLLVGY
jgi:hypothetical protein